ncbi:MAG: hypothetical protein VW235_03155 [Rhodospirillaceae bacterium]|jgi:hypothetical protein
MDVVKLGPVFPDTMFKQLKDTCYRQHKRFPYSDEFGRYGAINHDWKTLNVYTDWLLPAAREIFKSETLLPSYSMFVHYEGEKANLMKHKDNNACTYTMDLCLYQKTPWGLIVEGEEFMMEPNEALCFYGEDQEHWRNEFPDPDVNEVGQVFFHFVEPDHWFFHEKL